MSLRLQLLLLFTALALGATALFGALAYQESRALIRQNALHAVEMTSRAREDALRRRLQARHSRAVTFLGRVEGCSPAECERDLSGFLAVEGAAAGALARPGATAIRVGPGATSLARPSARRSGELARFGFHAPGRPFYLMRVAHPGGTVLTLRFDDLRSLNEIFSDHSGLGSAGETFLADNRGYFLTPPRHPGHSGQIDPIAAVPMRRCLSGKSGTMLAPDYRGTPVIHAFRYLPYVGGGCIMAHVQQAEAFRPAGALGRRITGFGLGLAALSVLLSALLARTVTRPILRLREAAEGLGRGDFDRPLPHRGPAEVRALAASFSAMARAIHEHTRELEAANRAKSQFLAMMSHEIRTPINAVIGYTDLMQLGISGPLSPQQAEHLDRIKGSSHHLLSLINDVLDFSKVEAGEMEVWREATPVEGTAKAALELVAPQAAAKGVELRNRSECASDAAYLGDEDRVRQILVNLLSNAVKFTEPGGHVSIGCRVCALPEPEAAVEGQGPWARFDVQDTGIGIRPDQIQRIFEPFTQAEEGHTRRHEGTGLGLTISRRFARLMGGDITVSSTPGRGSCFTLWLPGVSSDAGPDPFAGEGAWPSRPHEVPGLSRLGELLGEHAEAVVGRLSERLRHDPAVPGAHGVDRLQLDDHIALSLVDLGQTLVLLDAGGAQPDLLRDGLDIKRLIAARHGEQRARLGWSQEEISREYALLREEIDRMVEREASTRGDEELSAALRILYRLLDRAERVSVESMRSATRAL